jgi:DNA-binding SARP family transcriptional activator
MEVRLLGPVEVHADTGQLPIRGPIQRALVAMLALHANRVVTSQELMRSVWGPASTAARRSLQWQVWQLRRLLGTHADRLVYRAPGYLLRVEPGELDLARFQDLADQGRELLAAADAEEAGRLLGAALALWRGRALEDVQVAALAEQGARLEQRRLAVAEDRVQADLDAGRGDGLVAELEGLVAAEPLRERLTGLLMVALYRSGRQADALAAFRALRRRLVEQQGVEPGRPVQELQRRILAADPDLDPPAAATAGARITAPAQVPVPRQLPPDVAGFTGREPELVQLDRALAAAGQDGPVVIGAIQGTAGIGKSALAVHAAHRLAGRFPDGKLDVDLHGATAGLEPLAPLEVLGRFLRALGVAAAAVPADLEEASAAFRSRVAGRRLLVVLDNAVDAAQVRPLLPAAAGCGVLVTSRQLLASLDGATHLHLDTLPAGDATALLGRLAGEQRVAAEPQAAAEVARCCGYLPLALRIVGARLAARPGWPLAALAERLADAQRRLDELEVAEAGVRASYDVSYQQLQASSEVLDRAAAAFGLLGVLDGPELGVPVAARLLESPEEATERVLERLVDAQLLETPSPGRYRLHDLLRLYAREQAARLRTAPERAAALGRVLGLYAATAWHTMRLLRPADPRLARADDRWTSDGLEFADATAALDWLEAERANLLAAIRQAAATPGIPGAVAIQLAHALFGMFSVRSHWQDWVQVNQTALGIARQLGDRAAQAQVQADLGFAYCSQSRYAESVTYTRESLAIRRALGDRLGQGASLNNLGIVYERQGRLEEALACHQEGLAIKRELGDRFGLAISLSNVGEVYQRLGRYQEALDALRESLALHQQLDDRRGQAFSLGYLGNVHERLGRYQEALDCLRESLAIRRDLGDRAGQASCLTDLGIAHQRQGRHQDALDCLEESLNIRRELGDSYGQADSLRALGVTLRALGHAEEARAHLRQALAIFERLKTTDADQVRALLAE